MDVSVVVVSWNTRDLLAACLASVERAEPAEVVVVDNASDDGSPAMVRERFPGARLVENGANAGFARACNQGIRAGSAELVLLLNPDCELPPGALERLVAFLREHPDAAAAGPRLVGPGGALERSCSRFPTLFREFWQLFHLDAIRPLARYPMERWATDEPRRVDVIQGACLLLRRDALEQVGLLDEDYFLYSEEVDLCHRLHRAGASVFWVPAARVLHHGGASTRQAARPSFLRLYESKVIWFRKRRGRAAARLLAAPLALLERAAARRRHLALAGHYRRLLAALPGW